MSNAKPIDAMTQMSHCTGVRPRRPSVRGSDSSAIIFFREPIGGKADRGWVDSLIQDWPASHQRGTPRHVIRATEPYVRGNANRNRVSSIALVVKRGESGADGSFGKSCGLPTCAVIRTTDQEGCRARARTDNQKRPFLL